MSDSYFCYCTLTGHFHAGEENEFCELCDCKEQLTLENIKTMFGFLNQELDRLRQDEHPPKLR
jgi:hypothetical protein